MYKAMVGGCLEKVFSTTGVLLPKGKGSMVKGERYAFQVAFSSRWTGIQECTIHVESKIADCIHWRVEEYAGGKYTLPEKHDRHYIYKENKVTTFPDVLKPFGSTDLFLRANLWTTVYFTVENPQIAGSFPIQIELWDKSEDVMCECNFRLEVVEANLPACDIPVLQRIRLDSICDYHRVAPCSEAFFDMFGKYLSTNVKHGGNSVLLPLLDERLPLLEGAEYSRLEKLLAFSKEQGVSYFFLDALDKTEVYPSLLPLLLKLKIEDKTFFAVEKNKWKDVRGEVCEVVQIQDFLSEGSTPTASKKWLTYDKDATHSFYTNRHLNMPLQRVRVLGLQMYLNGVQGFVHDGFNNYYNEYGELINPNHETDGTGAFPSGDAFCVYPSYPNATASVYDSLRLEAFSDAIEDYRCMLALEKCKGKAFAKAFLEERGFYGFSVYPTGTDEYLWLREEINSIIRGEV